DPIHCTHLCCSRDSATFTSSNQRYAARTFPGFGGCVVRHRTTTNSHAETGKIFSCASESDSTSDPVREENCTCAKDFRRGAGHCSHVSVKLSTFSRFVI